MSNEAAVIDSTAVEVFQAPSVTLVPPVKAGELVQRLEVIKDAMNTAMVKDIDYGHIPGTDKPALLKPGAEKLGVLFQLDVQLVNEKQWGPGDHLTVMSQATVFHAPSGSRLGFGEGLCSTREKKYAYRKQERACPTCGAAAVIKGKAEYGGGWLCWKKRDGCGAKFPDGDERIESQPVGEIDNPDLPDLWNTVVKMAEKRARVDAVLSVTGASALFTQDVVEDEPRDEPPAEPAPGAPVPDLELVEIARSLTLTGRELRQAHNDARIPFPAGPIFCGLTVEETAKLAEAMFNQRTDVPVDPADFQPPVAAVGVDEFERSMIETFDAKVETP